MERAMVLRLREPPARTHTAPADPGQPRPGRQQPETTAGEGDVYTLYIPVRAGERHKRGKTESRING